MVELETNVAREELKDALRFYKRIPLRNENVTGDSVILRMLCQEGFYENVVLRMHPNGDFKAWEKHRSDNFEASSMPNNNRVKLRFEFRGRYYDVDESEIRTDKCAVCIAIQYNPGLLVNLCYAPEQCPAVNSMITDINKLGFKPGERARDYVLERTLTAGINYA